MSQKQASWQKQQYRDELRMRQGAVDVTLHDNGTPEVPTGGGVAEHYEVEERPSVRSTGFHSLGVVCSNKTVSQGIVSNLTFEPTRICGRDRSIWVTIFLSASLGAGAASRRPPDWLGNVVLGKSLKILSNSGSLFSVGVGLVGTVFFKLFRVNTRLFIGCSER